MGRWYDECPERLDAELRALQNAGFVVELDEKERAAGQIVLHVKCPIQERVETLRVVFPWNYPFSAFAVFAPALSFKRHQDPISKQLCFVARIDSEWQTQDTVAKYLHERLPKIIDANNKDTYDQEAREGAPITGYLTYETDSLVLVGDWQLPVAQTQGTLVIGTEVYSNMHESLRGAVHEVRNDKNALLGEAEEAIKRAYSMTRLNGRWVRLSAPPMTADVKDLLAEAVAVWPELQKPQFRNGVDVIGVVFRDEARYRELHDIWVFIVRAQTKRMSPERQARFPGQNVWKYLARSDRASRSDLQARVPRLKPLATKRIAVFGLGALGSMVVWQLTRAGAMALPIVDHDFVEAGTTARWVMGMIAAGRYKCAILKNYLTRSYPFAEIIPIPLRVGSGAIAPDVAEQLMAQAVDGADMIIDCTVEHTVHHYLSTLAWKRGIPYLWTSGTPGGFGGIVARAVRGKTTGCWKCYSFNRIAGAYGSPEQEDESDVQPVGCFSPTFTGSGIDMDHISIAAARLAVATLCHPHEGGYPDFDWDIGVVDLWKNNRPIAPAWRTFTLTRHPDCDGHA